MFCRRAGGKHGAAGARTCTAWLNHAHKVGERLCPRRKMKVERKTSSPDDASPGIPPPLTPVGLLLLLLLLTGKTKPFFFLLFFLFFVFCSFGPLLSRLHLRVALSPSGSLFFSSLQSFLFHGQQLFTLLSVSFSLSPFRSGNSPHCSFCVSVRFQSVEGCWFSFLFQHLCPSNPSTAGTMGLLMSGPPPHGASVSGFKGGLEWRL